MLVRYNSVFVYTNCVHPVHVFNPNVITFQSNCAESLHFSAFHCYCSLAGYCVHPIHANTECPTIPLWARQSRFGGKCPASRGDLARDAFCPALGKKVTCATARLRDCAIVHMSEHENRTGRYTTKDRARRATKHAYTCTHVHMTLFRCQNRTVWALAQRI